MSVVTGTADRNWPHRRCQNVSVLVLNLDGSAEEGKNDHTSCKQRDRGVNIV